MYTQQRAAQMVPQCPREGKAVWVYEVPCAGGNAPLFRTWQKNLPANIHARPVELPGRSIKSTQRPIGDYRALIGSLVHELMDDFRVASRQQPGLRYAIFGHSAGARFGFAIAFPMQQELQQAPGFIDLPGA